MNRTLVFSFIVAILIDIGFPLAAAIWFRHKHDTSWKTWFFGALVFAVFQLFTRVPLVSYLGAIWGPDLVASTPLLIGWIALSAITAGLAEEGGRWLAYRYLFPRNRVLYQWRTGVMFGLGHGGLESILLVGGAAIASLATYLYLSQANVVELGTALPEGTLEGLRMVQQQFASLQGWEPLLGGVERVLTLCVQVFFSVLVLQCFVRGQRRWFWIAVAAHALVDFVVPLAAQGGSLLVPELVLALFSGAALWGILRLRDEERAISTPGQGALLPGVE